MAEVKMLAPERFEGVEVEDDSGETPVWEQIAGITDLTWSTDTETEDVADWDNEGHGEDLVTQRTKSVDIEAFALIDPETGEAQAGQKIIDDAANKVGYASRVKVRVDLAGGKYREFTANVEPADQGGGVTDPSGWGATLTAVEWPQEGSEE